MLREADGDETGGEDVLASDEFEDWLRVMREAGLETFMAESDLQRWDWQGSAEKGKTFLGLQQFRGLRAVHEDRPFRGGERPV